MLYYSRHHSKRGFSKARSTRQRETETKNNVKYFIITGVYTRGGGAPRLKNVLTAFIGTSQSAPSFQPLRFRRVQ